jgi:hypothetical protein
MFKHFPKRQRDAGEGEEVVQVPVSATNSDRGKLPCLTFRRVTNKALTDWCVARKQLDRTLVVGEEEMMKSQSPPYSYGSMCNWT